MRRYFITDVETFSTVDLKRAGTYRYANDPSTEVLCACWREVGTQNRWSWSVWGEGNASWDDYKEMIENPNNVVWAHNAGFERTVLNVKQVRLTRDRTRCSMVLCLTNGLPASLEKAGAVLELPMQKDTAGHRLMMKLCRPRKPTKNDKRKRWMPDDPALAQQWSHLLAYCMRDVDATHDLITHPALVPVRLTDWQDYACHERINDRGVMIDRPFVQALEQVCREAQGALSTEFAMITGINKPTEVQSFLSWLYLTGYTDLEDCSKDTLTAALSDPALREAHERERIITGVDVRRALEIRLEFAKASIGKLSSMLRATTDEDAVARGMIQFNGAAATGRGAGRLVQVHNFPRKTNGDPMAVKAEVLASPMKFARTKENPLAIASSMLRPCMIPAPGHVFIIFDWSAIEARALGWAANDAFYLNAFRGDGKLYEAMAAKIFGKLIEEILADSEERFLGKTTILGCGYQMGENKFINTARKQGATVSTELLRRAHTTYRDEAEGVRELWRVMGDTARWCIETGKPVHVAGRFAFRMWGNALLMRLPSGRTLCYRNAHIATVKAPWQVDVPMEQRDDIEQIQYWTVKNSRWVLAHIYGGKFVENAIQALCNCLMRFVLRDPWMQRHGVLHVHDEGVAQVRESIAAEALERMRAIMKSLPEWAAGMPIDASGKIALAYGK